MRRWAIMASCRRCIGRIDRPALRWQDVPAFIAELRTCERAPARVLEFQILTAARPVEARLARWEEIDVEAKVWSVPAERMKARVEHRVPLNAQAIAVLGGHGAGLVWTVGATAVWRLQPPGATAHGFRSSFRDWASETTSAPHAVMEACLAHQIPTDTERAYARSDLLDKRRALMTAWAEFCGGVR
jgi:integrase